MQKVKTTLVCVMLCAALLCAACGKKGAASGAVPTLVWWMIGTDVHELADDVKLISDYTEEKIGVRFEIRLASWGQAVERLNTVINSGEYYDILFVNGNRYYHFAQAGAFTPLDDMLSGAPEFKNAIPELLWKSCVVGGHTYAVPTYKDSSLTTYYVWDDNYVKKYNIDITDTSYANLDKAFRAMKAGEGKRFYPYMLNRSTWVESTFSLYDKVSTTLPPLGVRIDDASRRVVSVLEQPDIQEMLRYAHQWYQDGIINPDANVQYEGNKHSPFLAAIGFPGAEVLWQVDQNVEKYDIQRAVGPIYSNDSIQGSLNAISVNSKYKKEALKLLELANTDHKFRDMLAYGIEGRHFEYLSPNVIRKLTDTWNLAAYQQGSFFVMSTVEGQDTNQWENLKKQNESAVPSPVLGFIPDLSDLEAELANCRAVWEKYNVDMCTGVSDPAAAIPACLKDLRANDFDKIIAETQRQIDNHFKEKEK